MKTKNLCFIILFISSLIILNAFQGCKKKLQEKDHIYSNEWPVDTTEIYGHGLIPMDRTEYEKLLSESTATGASTGQFDDSFEVEIPLHPFNQGGQGSCTGVAVAMAKSILDHKFLNIQYPDNGIIYSPSYLYSQTISKPGYCVSGGQLRDALNILRFKGICTEAEMKYIESDCTTLPNAGQNKSAQNHKIDSWQPIPQTVSTIKQWLKSGVPVIVGFHVDQSFESDYFFKQEIKNKPWKNTGLPFNKNVGHAAVLYGWDDSKHSFKMLNQYGEGWGMNGSIFVDYDLVENLDVFYEAYILFNPANSTIINKPQISGDLNFGSIPLNSSNILKETLSNVGKTNITVSNFSVSAPFSANWTGGIIQPGESIEIEITFRPTVVGKQEQDVKIYFDTKTPEMTVKLTGNGLQQQASTRIINLNADLAFGAVKVGNYLERTLTISNGGNSPLNIISLNTPNGFSGGFNGRIEAGTSVPVTIRFGPSEVRNYNGSIIVNSDATTGNSSIQVSGSGVSNSTTSTAQPAIGTYGPCGVSGHQTICYAQGSQILYSDGVINAAILDIDRPNHKITFEIKKCNDTNFNEGGHWSILPGDCLSGSYDFQLFSGGASSFKFTVIDNNMTGTKKYFPIIFQGANSQLLFDAPTITVYYGE